MTDERNKAGGQEPRVQEVREVIQRHMDAVPRSEPVKALKDFRGTVIMTSSASSVRPKSQG